MTPRRSKTSNISPLTVALAGYLRSMAAEKMLTQADVARATNMDKKQVSQIWRGLQEMTVDEMGAMFSAIGVDPATVYARALRRVRESNAPHVVRDIPTEGDASRAV